MDLFIVGCAVILAALVAGCSPDFYKADADAQVQRILAERKETVLGYDPKTAPRTTASPAATRPAYAMIPFTPIPPPQKSPIEPDIAHAPPGKLGPPWPPPPTLPSMTPLPDLFGVRAAEKRDADRLRLGPPAPGDPTIDLDLFRSIQYAVQHSPNYQDEVEAIYLDALNVTLQRHLFEPRPFVSESVNYTGGQKDLNYEAALAATTTAGITQQLPYGGTVTAQALVTFVNALNANTADGESATLALTGSIPLLRGAGMVNLEPLIKSERALVYGVRNFEDFRRSFAVNVATQYFDLLTQQQSVSNRRINYDQLEGLTERTEAIYQNGPAGRVQFADVQRALQAQYDAESSLIDAQETYAANLDSFKILIGMKVTQPLEIVPVELQVNVPDVDQRDVTKLALTYRLDLQTARDQVDDARRAVANAANGLLPDLNFTASGQIGNEATSPAENLNGRTTGYSAGLTLNLPVDRVAERNSYRAALIGLESAMRGYVLTEQQVISDVRDAVRKIRQAEMNLDIATRGIQLAEQRVELANDLLVAGTADNRDVVDAESSLISAQDDFESARAQLQIQVLQFLRLTGTLRIDPAGGALGQAMDMASAMHDPGGGTQ